MTQYLNFSASFIYLYIWFTKPKNENKETYWKTNLKYLVILLSIWFTVSYGSGSYWPTNSIKFKWEVFKLGFWFAQQGAIYVFVILIFVYIYLMNRLDQKFKNKV